VDVPDFVIAVKLSPEAETRVNSIHKSIEVLAMFDGDPLPGQGKYSPPNRDVVLGHALKPVDAKNEARFNNLRIPLSDWADAIRVQH
jgi:hypothetical protein